MGHLVGYEFFTISDLALKGIFLFSISYFRHVTPYDMLASCDMLARTNSDAPALSVIASCCCRVHTRIPFTSINLCFDASAFWCHFHDIPIFPTMALPPPSVNTHQLTLNVNTLQLSVHFKVNVHCIVNVH